jgi:hypothetical protein
MMPIIRSVGHSVASRPLMMAPRAAARSYAFVPKHIGLSKPVARVATHVPEFQARRMNLEPVSSSVSSVSSRFFPKTEMNPPVQVEMHPSFKVHLPAERLLYIRNIGKLINNLIREATENYELKVGFVTTKGKEPQYLKVETAYYHAWDGDGISSIKIQNLTTGESLNFLNYDLLLMTAPLDWEVRAPEVGMEKICDVLGITHDTHSIDSKLSKLITPVTK